MRRIGGLGEVARDYDGFIVDLWGVVHDGVAPYPAALECLRRLAGSRVLLLSNAPRRASSTRRMLQRMGLGDELYTGILTSGEAVWLALHDRADPWFARLGSRVYHLGPERDRGILDGLGLRRADRPDGADFVLNTGPDDDVAHAATLDVFVPELQACLDAGLPMICANPDLVVMRDGVRLLCAGSLAAYYAQAGGDVASFGKPEPAIYAMALGMLGVPHARVLAVGDSLHTDIAGAAAAGLASAWVLGGIHSDLLGRGQAAADLAEARGAVPSMLLDHLAW